MPRRYWLMKCEPEAYTIEDLESDGGTTWEGVRNYQARNLLRDDMQVGDGVLFYASNAEPSGVTGLARIVRSGFPDPTAWRKGHEYFDPASTTARAGLVLGRDRFRRALRRDDSTGDAQGDARAREDDGDAERQPPLGPAGDQGGVSDRRRLGRDTSRARTT